MSIQAGARVTHIDGSQGVIIKTGEFADIMSLPSGEMQTWQSTNYTADERQEISTVFVVNPPPPLKVTTIMWGVFLGNILAGLLCVIGYFVVYGVAR